MVFDGQIAEVMPVQSGVSKTSGNEWRSQSFVFEYFENPTDRYADRVVLEVMNERIDALQLKQYDKVRVGFGHSVREYQGRKFNQLRCYSIEKLVAYGADRSNGSAGQVDGQVAGQQAQVAQEAGQEGGKKDDLPF